MITIEVYTVFGETSFIFLSFIFLYHRRAMKTLGEPLTESELEIMMKEADRNHDGRIDYEGKLRDPQGPRHIPCCYIKVALTKKK